MVGVGAVETAVATPVAIPSTVTRQTHPDDGGEVGLHAAPAAPIAASVNAPTGLAGISLLSAAQAVARLTATGVPRATVEVLRQLARRATLDLLARRTR